MRPVSVLLLHALTEDNVTLSYQRSWVRHFECHPRFDCHAIDVCRRGAHTRALGLLRLRRYDAIVMLHSIFSNICHMSQRLIDAVAAAKPLKAYFIGNEFKLMPEKMAFCEQTQVSLLVTQTRSRRVHELYRERLGCAVVGIPNTGLDPTVFRSDIPRRERPTDLGYRCFDGAAYLGHIERRAIGEFFVRNNDRYHLALDISMEPSQRFTERDWARFLGRCKGQLGTEAGSDYFELTDATRHAVNEYRSLHPAASFDVVVERFFKNYKDQIPIRIISGRNVEAAGTRTVQILFEGTYDAYFEPDVHYIALKKDFSNADDVVRRFRDEAFCERVTENAWRVASKQLTYASLIDRFHEALEPLLQQ